MDNFQVSYPESVFQWEAFRELHRHDLHTLDVETLATLYGFSTLPEYRDDVCLRAIEDLMDNSADPIRSRYELACSLGNYFDGDHYLWTTLFLGTPNQRDIRPDEPGYVSPIPRELHQVVTLWICEGIRAFGRNDPAFEHVRNIAARFDGGYTFLDKEAIDQFRIVSGDPLTLANNLRAQERIAQVKKILDDLAAKQKDARERE